MLLTEMTQFLQSLTGVVLCLHGLAFMIVITGPWLILAVETLFGLWRYSVDTLKKSKLIAALVHLGRFLRDYISLR